MRIAKIGPRVPILAVLVLTVLLLAVLGPGSPAPTGLVTGAAADFAMPTVDEPDVLSSTWYCAAGAADGGMEDLSIVIANPLDDARRGSVTWFADGERQSETIQVGGNDSLTLDATDAVEAAQVSAVVEVEGGGVAVEHRLTGVLGTTLAPCSSAPSDEWHLANGSTSRDARQRFYLFNPFPDDAIVDITFSADGPAEAPPALQGLAVSPLSTTVVDVGEHIRREDVTAATITTRSGRLVVDRLQYFTGEGDRTGISLAVAAPAAAPEWYFAGGRTGENVTQRWHLYNPGDDEAIVLLEVTPDKETTPEPVERTIRPGSSVIVVADDIPLLDPTSGFAVTVRTINDVPVVAEREIDARPPGPRVGWTSTFGSPLDADRWVVPTGMGSDTVNQTIVVSNPSPEPVVASVMVFGGGTLAEVPDGGEIELGPADRVAVPVGAGDQDPVSILVEADGPVVVERHLDFAPTGIDASLGIPLR